MHCTKFSAPTSRFITVIVARYSDTLRWISEAICTVRRLSAKVGMISTNRRSRLSPSYSRKNSSSSMLNIWPRNARVPIRMLEPKLVRPGLPDCCTTRRLSGLVVSNSAPSLPMPTCTAWIGLFRKESLCCSAGRLSGARLIQPEAGTEIAAPIAPTTPNSATISRMAASGFGSRSRSCRNRIGPASSRFSTPASTNGSTSVAVKYSV